MPKSAIIRDNFSDRPELIHVGNFHSDKERAAFAMGCLAVAKALSADEIIVVDEEDLGRWCSDEEIAPEVENEIRTAFLAPMARWRSE